MTHTARTMILVGLISGLGGCEPPGSTQPSSSLNYDAVLQAIARNEDRISPERLADWVIQDKRDFVVVDIRSSKDFDQGHIDHAHHLPVSRLLDANGLTGIPSDRKIIVYSNGTENGAKASVLLRLLGREALVLQGGYNAWQRQILNPDLETADEETLTIEKRRAMSCHFAGDSTTGAPPAPPPAAPPVAFSPPVAPASIETPGSEAIESPGLIVEEGC